MSREETGNNYLSCLSMIYSIDAVIRVIVGKSYLNLMATKELAKCYKNASLYFDEYKGVGLFVPLGNKGFIMYPSGNDPQVKLYYSKDGLDIPSTSFVPKLYRYEDSFYVDYGSARVLKVPSDIDIFYKVFPDAVNDIANEILFGINNPNPISHIVEIKYSKIAREILLLLKRDGYVLYFYSYRQSINVKVNPDKQLTSIDEYIPSLDTCIQWYMESYYPTDDFPHLEYKVPMTINDYITNPYSGKDDLKLDLCPLDGVTLFNDHFMTSYSNILGVSFKIFSGSPKYYEKYYYGINNIIYEICKEVSTPSEGEVIIDYSLLAYEMLEKLSTDEYIDQLEIITNEETNLKQIKFIVNSEKQLRGIKDYLPSSYECAIYASNFKENFPYLELRSEASSITTVEPFNVDTSMNKYPDLPDFDILVFGDDVYYDEPLASVHKNAMIVLCERVVDLYNGYISTLSSEYEWMYFDNAVLVIDKSRSDLRYVINVFYYNGKYNNTMSRFVLPKIDEVSWDDFDLKVDYSNSVLTLRYKYQGKEITKIHDLRRKDPYTPILSDVSYYIDDRGRLGVHGIYYARGVLVKTLDSTTGVSTDKSYATYNATGTKLSRIIV